MDFDWNELAFASKKPLNALKATFIAAPRELSAARFTQLVKEYLPKGNIILGLAKEPFVLGFENHLGFRLWDLSGGRKVLGDLCREFFVQVAVALSWNRLVPLRQDFIAAAYLHQRLGTLFVDSVVVDFHCLGDHHEQSLVIVSNPQ
jgi:hypothetical protein